MSYKRVVSQSAAWNEENERLINELKQLCRKGYTRNECYAAFEGRRGQTWVKKHFGQGAVRKREAERSQQEEIYKNLLMTMAIDGNIIADAVRALTGKRSPYWVHKNWPREAVIKEKKAKKHKIPANIYGHMNIEPRKRLERL